MANTVYQTNDKVLLNNHVCLVEAYHERIPDLLLLFDTVERKFVKASENAVTSLR